MIKKCLSLSFFLLCTYFITLFNPVQVMAADTNHALNRPVVVYDSGANDSIGDPGSSKLTDGILSDRTAPSIWAGEWAKFNGAPESRSIVIDLSETKTFNSICISTIQEAASGVLHPSTVGYYISDDSTNWTLVGNVESAIPQDDNKATIQDFKLDKISKSARYVKVVFPVKAWTWVFAEEITILQYDIEGKAGNIAAYKPYTTIRGVSTDSSYSIYDSKDDKKLTDCLYGNSADISDEKWLKFCRGLSRDIIIDLENTYSVEGFAARFIQSKASAVHFPRDLSFSVSQNGVEWEKAGSLKNPVSLSEQEISAREYKLDLSVPYKARYVKVTFNVDIWVFCDEIEVYGSGELKGTELEPKAGNQEEYVNAYLPQESDKLGKANDIVLMYNGYNPWNPSDTDFGFNTVEELLPYAGYTDTNGTITDFMFDSFLWLPFVGGTPSGGAYYYDPAKPSNSSDWVYYLENLFDSENNMSALDQAVGKVKQDLNSTSHKTKVYICIPYPTQTQANFGDIDGDGNTENLTNYEDRIKVIKWYIDKALKMWEERSYKNLELTGFYWYEEQVRYESSDAEQSLILETSQYLDSKSKSLIWIPFYQAPGFAEWDKLGIAGAAMQPNYCFSSFPKSIIAECAKIAKKFGLGVEIEIHNDAMKDPQTYIPKYKAYLKGGIDYGYMKEAVHMYYQFAGPGIFYESAKSSDAYKRSVYDDTYRFIKKTYTAIRPIANNMSLLTNKDTLLGKKLSVYDADTDFRDLKYTIVSQPLNGSVQLGDNGEFIYTPAPGFSGMDSFEYKVEDDTSESNTAIVDIKVSGSDSGSSENSYAVQAKFNSGSLIANELLTAEVMVTNNGNETGNVLGIVALYDENDRMVNISSVSKEIGTGKTEKLCTGFRLPANIGGYKVKVFVWDGTDIGSSGMKPLSKVIELK